MIFPARSIIASARGRTTFCLDWKAVSDWVAWKWFWEGPDILIVTLGSISAEVVKAADRLAEQGVGALICVVSSLRPAPSRDLSNLLERFRVSLTVEEHYTEGGLGSLVCEIEAEAQTNCRIIRCGVRALPTSVCGSEESLREANGLSAEGICKTALKALEEHK